MKPEFFDQLLKTCSELKDQENNLLPLCAAENVMSPFSKIPLDSFLQEKYIIGGILNYQQENNFIGSAKLYEIYNLLNMQCAKMFNCQYADARSLSGVNAVSTLLMSLFSPTDTVLISSEDCGGHGSMPKICHRLGIKTKELPFDYSEFDFNYEKCNEILEKESIQGILICVSDIIKMPELHRLNLPPNCILIFDATQILGLIATQNLPNPLSWFKNSDNFILMGATHKTIPGPTCGLVMTNNLELAERFDIQINPDYLRNNQLHHILSLILALMELEIYGKDYSDCIVNNANTLGNLLEMYGFNVLRPHKQFTSTHQLFISMPYNSAKKLYDKCLNYGVSLNLRNKYLYQTCGLRLGTQEVTRYGWAEKEMKKIASLFRDIQKTDHSILHISEKINDLVKNKSIHYTLDHTYIDALKSVLHNS